MEKPEWQAIKDRALGFLPLLSKSDGRNRNNKDTKHSWTHRISSIIFVIFADLCKWLFEIEFSIHSRPEDSSWRFSYYNFCLWVNVFYCTGCLEKQRKREHICLLPPGLRFLGSEMRWQTRPLGSEPMQTSVGCRRIVGGKRGQKESLEGDGHTLRLKRQRASTRENHDKCLTPLKWKPMVLET